MAAEQDFEKALAGYTIPVHTAAKVFGLGKNAAYAAVKRGEIPSIRIGGKLVIPTAKVREMLGLEPEAA